MLVTPALIAASVGALASPSALDKAMPRLSDQVDASTFICIGTVDEVFTVSFPHAIEAGRLPGELPKTELRFGRVRVERVLKGDSHVRVVFHEAWSTWVCDDTRDAVGERALFLLAPGAIAAAGTDDKQRAAHALGSDLILRNVDSGDGIVPILRDGELEYVALWSWETSLRESDRAKGATLSKVLSWIESTVRFAPDAVAVHARCNKPIPLGPGAADTFDLRILPDGSRRLARRVGDQDTMVVDRIDAGRWSALQAALRLEIQKDERVVASKRVYWLARVLTIRLDGHQLEFSQAWDQELDDIDDDREHALEHALGAWASLWEVLDCPTCTDYRASDTRWLEKR